VLVGDALCSVPDLPAFANLAAVFVEGALGAHPRAAVYRAPVGELLQRPTILSGRRRRIRYTIPRSGDPSARRGCVSPFKHATSVGKPAQEEANVEASMAADKERLILNRVAYRFTMPAAVAEK
jgi:hypothetical protein